ncbi:hypothetical protein HK105_206059 [Polyrhizophydium stewartii]|uniref:NADH dehydrogenase subunit 4L n=1 Tax=Polyrhizophydium stewartii TaxID=2732419 RepID=A0ABR4N4N9_9FUNG
MEEMAPVVVFMVLTVISCIVHIFYMIWQSYVLLFDVVLNALSLALIVGELITGGLLIANLAKSG